MALTDAHPIRQADGRSRYRTMWLSDVHLGTQGCDAGSLLAFLERTTAERIYLVGDIVDLWRLRVRLHWPQAHADVVAHLLRRAREGTEILYLPGNHDDALRKRIGARFGSVVVVDDLIHTTADGRRFLVVHGDGFDVVSRHADWLWRLGARVYGRLQQFDWIINQARRGTGRRELGVSNFLKRGLKRAVNLIGRYDVTLVHEARRRGVDGIICGHVHHAELRDIEGVTYCNSGDWVESRTALVEHHDGSLSIVHGADPEAKFGSSPLPAFSRNGCPTIRETAPCRSDRNAVQQRGART